MMGRRLVSASHSEAMAKPLAAAPDNEQPVRSQLVPGAISGDEWT